MNTDLENPRMKKIGKSQKEKLEGLGWFSLGGNRPDVT